MLLWAIWQLDHNRWLLAKGAIQRMSQSVIIIKAWLLLINPLTLTLSSTLWVLLLTNLLFDFLNSLRKMTQQVNMSAALAALSPRLSR